MIPAASMPTRPSRSGPTLARPSAPVRSAASFPTSTRATVVRRVAPYAARTAAVGLGPSKSWSGWSSRKGEPARASRAERMASPSPRNAVWGTNSSFERTLVLARRRLDDRLVGRDDEDDAEQASRRGLIERPVERGLEPDRQHLLRHPVGDRAEPAAEAATRNQCGIECHQKIDMARKVRRLSLVARRRAESMRTNDRSTT